MRNKVVAYTDINSEDRHVQKTFAELLRDLLLPRLMSGQVEPSTAEVSA